MAYKVRYTHFTSRWVKQINYFIREGIEVYRHPEGRFVTLEFQGKTGRFRESFYPEQLNSVK